MEQELFSSSKKWKGRKTHFLLCLLPSQPEKWLWRQSPWRVKAKQEERKKNMKHWNISYIIWFLCFLSIAFSRFLCVVIQMYTSCKLTRSLGLGLERNERLVSCAGVVTKRHSQGSQKIKTKEHFGRRILRNLISKGWKRGARWNFFLWIISIFLPSSFEML